MKPLYLIGLWLLAIAQRARACTIASAKPLARRGTSRAFLLAASLPIP
jgi:hypothetical protein